MPMLTDSMLLQFNDCYLNGAHIEELEESTNRLRNKMFTYSTVTKTALSGNSLSAITVCMTDESVYLLSWDETYTNKQVYFDPSCILGSSYKGVMEIQAFEADFFAHVAFQSFKNYSGFTSTEQCSLEGEWLKNVPTIKIDEYSMKAFVQPITDYQPKNVVFVFNQTSENDDGQTLSSCGYYMLDKCNKVIGKVVIIIDSTLICSEAELAINLVRDYEMVERIFFMGKISTDYFKLKYMHLDLHEVINIKDENNTTLTQG